MSVINTLGKPCKSMVLVDAESYHFARWVAASQKGVKDPVLSRDLIFIIIVHMMAPLIQTIPLLFQAVDPQMHLHYLQ